MRIAQVAPLAESVPPQRYGGTERVVSYLTEALVAGGHEVTLFASGDSVTSAELVAVTDRSLRNLQQPCLPAVWHTILLDEVDRRANQFDVIHFHVDCTHYPMARRCPTPCVTTHHGRLDLPDLAALHRHFAGHPVVAISAAQRVFLPDANWCATVHHGLPQHLYEFNETPQNYFAFVGRMSPEKRVDRAIEIALACNTRLRIAAKIDVVDRQYFETVIRPLLCHPLIEFCGEVTESDKNKFIGDARALLFPIDWPEPFGLVMIEAMACGTPVIAYACGAVPEVVDHGVTGFTVGSQAQAFDAARRIAEIDRRACRRVFERRFVSSIMASEYVTVYESLVRARRRTCPTLEPTVEVRYAPGLPS
ncbi:glycosyltransferase family 4 protein [Aquabacterium sp. A7-Y]|uniref:glycosyltransferase family 4 protein n=1 Tax=Aquabacterium sp. A7-Y TaxID=1349605 RepID=UPI00223C9159|nr:glycosyltransferase family 4 protein [Aquabacterium sp. A7-Y]MCW7541160.1 glycosyltransferase family 4 protein [Aquabacterium sp. A7-Y]